MEPGLSSALIKVKAATAQPTLSSNSVSYYYQGRTDCFKSQQAAGTNSFYSYLFTWKRSISQN
jgi:hypothetical protein